MKFSYYIMMLVFSAVISISISSCNDDDVTPPNEEELITTLIYTLVSGTDTVTLSFVDIDGDGGGAPVIITDTLSSNLTYNGSVTLLNETETPPENITDEVALEAEEHQFFYTPSDSTLSVEYNDMDADNNPIGIVTTVAAGNSSTLSLTVILRHEPDKFGTGVSDGDITNAGGETDIEVTFPIVIQ